MRILVCGGRDYDDWETVEKTLADLYYSLHHEEQNIFLLISGGARGADTLAKKFAKKYLPDFSFWECKANWKKHGNAAGPIRNLRMLKEGKPDLVIAFPGGKGTAHMTKIAREAGVKVIQIKSPAPRLGRTRLV
jgi:hypothetical protein